MIYCVILGGGGAIFSQPFIGLHIKKHSNDGHGRYDLDLGDTFGKIQLGKPRAYLANKRIALHSQAQCHELHFFANFQRFHALSC
jgi:hypothetical protein